VTLHPFPNAVGPERIDAPVYFLSIPKTAGSTLSAFLQTLFLESEFWHRGGGRYWVDLLKLTPEELQHSRIINGHFAGYLFMHYPLPLRYFTFLRDPLARAISHYEHVLLDKLHYFHTLTLELGNFGAYLRDERTQPTVANFHLRSLGATFEPADIARTLTTEQATAHELEKRLDTMPLPQPIEELLRTAQARLDQMCFVGVTERFDDSLGLLCEVFGWPRPATIESHNINPRSRSAKDLPSEDLRLLKRLNEADIELYQVAKSRFERDWARGRFVYPQLHAFISYAQNAEDVLLYRALRDVRQGTYVDVGANDPSGDSVTKAFYDRGWRGVNIEPVTSLYEALVKQRPEDVNVNAAAGAAEAQKTLYEIPGTGLSTLDASVAQRHRSQGFKVIETSVPVRTLRSILAETPRTDIHFLKIDVEGWEREVLLGIDLTATRPWIIVVEATEPNTEIPSFSDWESLLLEHQYSFVFFDGLNRYYLARERKALKKAFSRPVNSGDVFMKASEAFAMRAFREAQWSLRKQSVFLREQGGNLAEIKNSLKDAEAYAKVLERERDGLKQELATHLEARATERVEATRQAEGLTQWATSADAYAKSLAAECENLRATLTAANDAREADRLEAIRQVDALTQWATSADAYAKSLAIECENLRATLTAANNARETERAEASGQIGALTEWATSADAYGKVLNAELEQWREKWQREVDTRSAEEESSRKTIQELTASATSAEEHVTLLLDEQTNMQDALCQEREARAIEQADAKDRAEQLQLRIAAHSRELADTIAMGTELKSTLQREQTERRKADVAWSDERRTFEANAKGLMERLQRAEANADALGAKLETLLENQARSKAEWQDERKNLESSIAALERSLAELRRHWAVRLLVSKRALSSTWEQ